MPIPLQEQIALSGVSKLGQMSAPARIAVTAFGLAAAIELLISLRSTPSLTDLSFLLMVGLAAITARAKIPLMRGSTLSILTSVVLTTMVLLGTDAAVL